MNVVGSTVLLLVFHPEDRICNISLRVAQELPYDCIFGVVVVRINYSLLSFAKDEDLKPSSDVPWIPFEKWSAANGGNYMSPSEPKSMSSKVEHHVEMGLVLRCEVDTTRAHTRRYTHTTPTTPSLPV